MQAKGAFLGDWGGRMAQSARGGRPPGVDGVTESDWQDFVENPMDFDPDELREFLAADMMDVPVAPGFRERLRRKLWLIVKMRYGRRTSEPS